ncbi:hypothetical protein P170DRAFT_460209, partial [Aspergillus steynii IBT 23096]
MTDKSAIITVGSRCCQGNMSTCMNPNSRRPDLLVNLGSSRWRLSAGSWRIRESILVLCDVKQPETYWLRDIESATLSLIFISVFRLAHQQFCQQFFTMEAEASDEGEWPPLPNEMTHEGRAVLGLHVCLLSLSTICMILRFLARRMASSLQIDDWSSLASLFFAYAQTITSTLSITIGHGGYEIQQYSESQLRTWMKMMCISDFFYALSVALTKLSILIFYHRIFEMHKTLSALISILMVVVVCYILIVTTLTIMDLALFGRKMPELVGDATVFNYIVGIINSVLDVFILAIPQLTVWRLQWTRSKKLLVSGVFFLGGITCILSIVRITTVITQGHEDITYGVQFIMIVTVIEMNTGIICTCLPMFPSLIRRWKRKLTPQNREDPGLTGSILLTIGRMRARQLPVAGGVGGSTEALNTEVDPVHQGASYHMADMKSPCSHNETSESSDMTISQPRSETR